MLINVYLCRNYYYTIHISKYSAEAPKSKV